MRLLNSLIVILFCLAAAQAQQRGASKVSAVPKLIRFSGSYHAVGQQPPAGIAAATNYARPHVGLRDGPALVFRCLRVCGDDGGVHADAVEIPVSPRLSSGAGGVRTFVPDVLLDCDMAGTCAVLHDGIGGFENRSRFRN